MKTLLIIGSLFLSIGIAVFIYVAIVEKVLAVIADKLYDKRYISFTGTQVANKLCHPFFMIFIPMAFGTIAWCIGAYYLAHDILMKAFPVIAVIAGFYVFIFILDIISKLLSIGLIIIRFILVVMIIVITIYSVIQCFC